MLAAAVVPAAPPPAPLDVTPLEVVPLPVDATPLAAPATAEPLDSAPLAPLAPIRLELPPFDAQPTAASKTRIRIGIAVFELMAV